MKKTLSPAAPSPPEESSFAEVVALIQPKLSPLVRVLPWTHNLLIMSRSKHPEEREFYLRLCRRERWGKRELERQLAGALYERTVLSPPKVSPAVREFYPDATTFFKDTYLFDFLQIPSDHTETDLHRALIRNLGRFLTELGRDFCFIGSEYTIQVGGRDFALDLLAPTRLSPLCVVRDAPRRRGKLSMRRRYPTMSHALQGGVM